MLQQANVQRIVEQHFIVCSHIQSNWQTRSRVNSSAGRIQREFPDRDSHSISAQVAQAEDSFAIGYDDDAHIFIRPVAEYRRDISPIFDRDEETTRPTQNMPILLAGLPDSWRIDNGHHLVKVVNYRAVEQR